MEDHDECIATEDEMVSLLHLGSRAGLNQIMNHLSLEYKSLLDYVYRDIIPEEADSISDNNVGEKVEDG